MAATLLENSRLLTAAEYAELGEDEPLRRIELLEGNLVMSPNPTARHMLASGSLYRQIADQLPSELVAIYGVGLDLQLVAPDEPGTVRAPDLVVVPRAEVDRAVREGGLLPASGAVLVVEIISAGSRRTDTLIKRAEYADAGIAHYWIVELEPQVSLRACRLVPGSGYHDDGPATGTFVAAAPWPVRLDLAALVEGPAAI